MENENPPSGQPDLNELQGQYLWLQKQVKILLVLLVVLGSTFMLFLWRQVRYVSTDLKGFRPNATKAITEYQQVSGPWMDTLVGNLVAYGRTNPEFAGVLRHYGLTNAPTPVTPPKK